MPCTNSLRTRLKSETLHLKTLGRSSGGIPPALELDARSPVSAFLGLKGFAFRRHADSTESVERKRV